MWIALGGTPLLGCSDPVGVEPIAGTFGLAFYNGIPLPADLGPLPPRDGTWEGDECNQIVTEGSLTLDGDDRSFTLRFLTVNACTGQMLSESEGSGVYEQSGASLHFVYDGDGTVTSDGIVETGPDGTRIVLQAGIDIELEFRPVPNGAIGASSL